VCIVTNDDGFPAPADGTSPIDAALVAMVRRTR
jgi:hypothetical protein